MACCYIAASMIAFIINTCELLDVDIKLQYNESLNPSKGSSTNKTSATKHTKRTDGLTILSLGGMTCAACVGNVERALQAVKGVDRVHVSLHFQEARISHPNQTSTKALIKAVQDAGYEAAAGERSTEARIETLRQTGELQTLKRAFASASRNSSILFALGSGLDYLGYGGTLEKVLTTYGRHMILLFLTGLICYGSGSWIHQSSWGAAKKRLVNMNTLISVSTSIGMIVSATNIIFQDLCTVSTYYQMVSGLVLITTAGKYLDLLSRRQATNIFVGLYSLLQETETVRLANSNEPILSLMLKATDEIIIDPYSVIPCDSYVISGHSFVNESIITGESMPREKSTGAFLLAGTRNCAGELRALVNQDQDGSFLSQMVTTVEKASTRKAVVQETVDKITRYFVWIIFCLATATAVVVFKGSAVDIPQGARINAACQRLMAVLASACPCALGLATPCAIMAGIDVAWRKGILMTDGAKAMEQMQGITHVVLDKTGTLTEGMLRVSELKIGDIWRDRQVTLFSLICAAEEQGAASHPVGTAIFRGFLPEVGTRWQKYKHYGGVRNLVQVAGHGVKCEVDLGDQDWKRVIVGNLSLMKESYVSALDSIPNWVDSMGSLVLVSVDGQMAASMILQDTLRPEAYKTIQSLKAQGLKISMLTGDTTDEANRIAQQLQISVLASSASPDKKLEHVALLQSSGFKVAMVGDGINDAPSLAKADIGIMLAHGNRCLSAGGNVLMLNGNLHSLLKLMEISKQTMKQVRVNVIWALLYNIAAVSLSASGGSHFGIEISPTVAAAMMSVSSVAITYQGLRLRQRLLNQLD